VTATPVTLRLARSGDVPALTGFRAMELVATLAGEPLYAAFAFCAVERYDVALANGLSLPLVRIAKPLPASLTTARQCGNTPW
jgi:hypothetical protein